MTKAAWMSLLCALRAKPNTHYNPFYIKTSHVGGRQTCCQEEDMYSWCRHMVGTHYNSLFKSDCSYGGKQLRRSEQKSVITGSLKGFIAAFCAKSVQRIAKCCRRFFFLFVSFPGLCTTYNEYNVQCITCRIKGK